MWATQMCDKSGIDDPTCPNLMQSVNKYCASTARLRNAGKSSGAVRHRRVNAEVDRSRKAAQSSLSVGFLSTHPASAERTADIDRAINALAADMTRVAPLPYDYAAIKAALGTKK